MKVIVIGAGVVGTAAAWYLAGDGHEVEVIERRDGAGLETSFANGGQISPCHAEPWAHPGVLPQVLRWLGREDAPLLVRWARWDPAFWAWGMRFIANCTARRAALNTERALRLSLYSRDCLRDLRAETGLAYDQRTAGILHIYRDPAAFDHAREMAGLMSRNGLERRILDPDACVAVEPALAGIHAQLAGGILTPGDESGDAHLFSRALAERAVRRGVRFRWSVAARRIELRGGRVDAVQTDTETLRADAYVLAAGCASVHLARALGLRLPIVPAKGYSLTLPLSPDGAAPTVSITDDEHKLVYSRLGQRLRIAGTAEMAGYDLSLTPSRLAMMRTLAGEIFPTAGDYHRAEPWTGLRPVTPDGVPLVGATPLPNLWLDTGHGTLGWTMACGSGRLIADLVAGRAPAIDPTGLGLDRYAFYGKTIWGNPR